MVQKKSEEGGGEVHARSMSEHVGSVSCHCPRDEDKKEGRGRCRRGTGRWEDGLGQAAG
jgi:hypothetical protein